MCKMVLMGIHQTSKKRKETKLERRVAAIETKLEGIEQILKAANLGSIQTLLQEVLDVSRAIGKR